MTGFLEELAARARGTSDAIAPRIATRFEPVPVEESSVAVPAESNAARGAAPDTRIERVREPSPPPPAPEAQPSLESRFAAIDRALRALAPSRPRIEAEPHHPLPAQRVIERHTERVETAAPAQMHQTTHHHTTIAPHDTHHHTTIAPRQTHVVHAAPQIERASVLHESKTIEHERVRHERIARERVTHERVVHQQHTVESIRGTAAAAPPAMRTSLAPPPPAPRNDPAPEPSIHISIGRIDVRAQTAPEKRAPSSPSPARPSLDDYVQRREGRRR